MRIDATGLFLNNLVGSGTRTMGCTATGYVIATASDVRLKENIKPIEIEETHLKLLELKPVTYQWINKTEMGDGVEIGLIAQEVIEVVPELTFKRDDGMYGVNYDRIPTLLLQSVKELQRQINELKAEIAILKTTTN
jgi:hypothetical protein